MPEAGKGQEEKCLHLSQKLIHLFLVGARLRLWVSVQIHVNASLLVSVNVCVFMVCGYVNVVFECVLHFCVPV